MTRREPAPRPRGASPGLARLPFEEQLARIRAAVSDPGSAERLLREAAALADPEPLAHLVDALAAAGRVDDRFRAVLAELVGELSDPGLQHLLDHELGPEADSLVRSLAVDALERWPVERPSALAFLVRWLRRRDPDAHARLLVRAREQTESPPAGDDAHGAQGAAADDPGPSEDPGRWLLLLSGARLAALRADPAWRPVVERTVARVIDALARAPKSISQANAEALLARRVYADQGHFLFELLQNADDAGAREWSVRVEADRVLVANDGAPFSFLDLVGVLSIGQTTKATEQIGFFGVGFKSVYEICERPRVHSGAFDVEIAHVSIPRALGPRPEGAGTLLVLPFGPGVQAEPLHRRALAIAPETLLTLQHLERIRVEGPDGSVRGWRRERDDDVAALIDEGAAQARRYRVSEGRLAFEGPREQGRPRVSPVLVAAELDAEGRPRARREPTLFSFLPTAERTGLRVLLHARFDVTLDRERLEGGSAWNHALLAEGGRTLAGAALSLVDRGRCPIEILAAPEELSPAMEPLAAAARAALDDQPCLAAADGSWLAPSAARLVAPALADALASVDLGDGARALAPLDGRGQAVALWLGARRFGPDELVRWLAGRLVEGVAAPGWLGRAVLEAIATASVQDAELRALPLLPDGSGQLRPASGAASASAPWAALYSGLRPVVPDASVAALPEALRARLSVRPFDRATLAGDLRGELGEALSRREPDLLDALDEADDELLRALSDVPLLRDRRGRRRPAAALFDPSPELRELEPALADRVPFVDQALRDRRPRLVARWIRTFDLPDLADAFEGGLLLDPGAAARLLSVLDAHAARLSRPLARRFAAQPLFEDHTGTLRPLLAGGGTSSDIGPADRGPTDRGPTDLGSADVAPARIAADPALRDVLPGWPWLAAADRPFVRALEPPAVDAVHVALALAGRASPAVAPAHLEAASVWLERHAQRLPGGVVDALARTAIWLDADGHPRPLDRLRRGGGPGAIDAYYAAARQLRAASRRVAHPVSARLADALGLSARLPASDHGALISDLVRAGEAPAVPAELLDAALLEAAARLPAHELTPLLSASLFSDEAGERRPLSGWDARGAHACRRPGPFREALRAGSLPLLDEAQEERLAPLLERIGPPEATVRDLVRRAEDLQAAPDALLAAVVAHADLLEADDRRHLAAHPLLRSRAGHLRRAAELCDPDPFLAALGPRRLDALELDDLWPTPEALDQARRLGLSLRPAADVLREIRAGLRADAPLDEQPAPWTSHDALWALWSLHRALDLAAEGAPLAVGSASRLLAAPVWSASESARRVAAGLSADAPVRARLADAAWAKGPVEDLTEPLPARRLAEALRAACPKELPRGDHPVVRDVDALLAWLREEAEAIEADPAAVAALGGAAVLPSQRGTLRAPRWMVLDPSLPDLGLDWGLAPDVPADVAAWLAATYELDLRSRRALVEHVLDGLDAAAEADDADRASELVRFLARALGAPGVPPQVLEQRARRAKVRARLRVPVDGGGWDKPRFAWAPTDAVAERASEFAAELPPRIALPELDAPARQLLAACGARSDLDEGSVEALLRGEGVRRGGAAPAELARYVASRALAVPARIERWRLTRRAWVPDGHGQLRRPEELLWPDELARALFGDDPARFADPAVTFDLPEGAAGRLGFARADALGVAEVAGRLGEREASPALLEWLEDGLRDGRLQSADVRARLRDALWLRDDEGVLRRPAELAVQGASRLLGRWRGDLAPAADLPRLARALQIPTAPDERMILDVLAEAGEAAAELDEAARQDLVRRLPECFERLGEAAEAGRQIKIPAGAAVAAQRAERAVLARIGDPALRMLEPLALAEGLPASALDTILEPLPSFDRSAALARLLWAAGVGDLWALFDVTSVSPGPERDDLREAAERLRADLAAVLGDAVGRSARVVDGLVARGDIGLRAGSGYRSPGRIEASTPADAVVFEGVLYMTPDALREPARLAAAIAREPERRAATARWLEGGEWEQAPRRVRRGADGSSADRSRERARSAGAQPPGLWSRLKRALGGDADAARRDPSARREPAPRSSSRGEGYFRPRTEAAAQLESTEGWLEDRLVAPDFGFAFAPARLPAPWSYAPNLVATVFDRRGQRWRATSGAGPAARPVARGVAGTVTMRGRLPKGDSLLPMPLYGRVSEVRLERGGDARTLEGPSGGVVLRLERAQQVRLRIELGRAPSLDDASPRVDEGAQQSFVPDEELPDEVLDFVADLGEEDPPAHRARAIERFIRARYRYDPAYLEDPAVGRWLSKITRGRANAHVAALHAASDAKHLGAGVCYELNVLACELLRRAGIPAGIATGWVFDGGSLSEPDHMWAIAFLEDRRGDPIWVPVDASTTASGRPLRVPRRPPGRFRKPRERAGDAPRAPAWDLGRAGRGRGVTGTGRGAGRGTTGRGAGRGEPSAALRPPRKPKKRRVPRAELRRVIRHLERVGKRSLGEDERRALEEALKDSREAARLLERLRGR